MGYDSVTDENVCACMHTCVCIKRSINNLQILIAEIDKIITVIKPSIQSCEVYAFSDIYIKGFV